MKSSTLGHVPEKQINPTYDPFIGAGKCTTSARSQTRPERLT